MKEKEYFLTVYDFLTMPDHSDALQQYLIEETDLCKSYKMEVDGLAFRRHIAKIDPATGLPKHLSQNRVRFGKSPVKGAFMEVDDGK